MKQLIGPSFKNFTRTKIWQNGPRRSWRRRNELEKKKARRKSASSNRWRLSANFCPYTHLRNFTRDSQAVSKYYRNEKYSTPLKSNNLSIYLSIYLPCARFHAILSRRDSNSKRRVCFAPLRLIFNIKIYRTVDKQFLAHSVILHIGCTLYTTLQYPCNDDGLWRFGGRTIYRSDLILVRSRNTSARDLEFYSYTV